MTSSPSGVILLIRRPPDKPAAAANKLCSIRTPKGVYTEFGIDPIGHSECYGLNRDNIRPKVIKLIELGVTDFYSGGMGSFDWMCAHVVYDLKKDYPQLNNHLVIPYLTFNILEKKYFDSIIYPEGFEKYHFKAAIPARNRYLVDNAKYALCYITHGWGGAAQTFERAKKKGPVIINLGEKDTSP